jgi:hypothetical protein
MSPKGAVSGIRVERIATQKKGKENLLLTNPWQVNSCSC